MNIKLNCRTDVKRILSRILIVVAIAVVYCVIGCPIRWLTGVCCPGCGMSRAVFSLVTFDFAAAFSYHPLVFCLPVAALILVFRKHLPAKLLTVLIWVFMAVLLIVYIYRIISGSETVYIDFSSGIIYKIFSYFKGSV